MEVAAAHVDAVEHCMHVKDVGERRGASHQINAADPCAGDLHHGDGQQKLSDTTCTYNRHTSPVDLHGAARNELGDQGAREQSHNSRYKARVRAPTTPAAPLPAVRHSDVGVHPPATSRSGYGGHPSSSLVWSEALSAFELDLRAMAASPRSVTSSFHGKWPVVSGLGLSSVS